MKIRIKFAKFGPVKFVGHLDMLRYFQKLVRRAGIDICYTEGFSPHQKMSFAAPLGVGMQGLGEYVDIEVKSSETSKTSVDALNAASVEGVQIKSYRLLPDGTPNAMSSVAAADYFVTYRDSYTPDFSLKEKLEEFLSAETIEIEKETKKSTAVIDIKPMIYECRYIENGTMIHPDLFGEREGIFFKLATGSVSNLKPELVLSAFYHFLGKDLPEFAYTGTRLEVYGNAGTEQALVFLALEDFGEEINEKSGTDKTE